MLHVVFFLLKGLEIVLIIQILQVSVGQEHFWLIRKSIFKNTFGKTFDLYTDWLAAGHRSSHQAAEWEPLSHLAVSHTSVGSVIIRAASLAASPQYLNGLRTQWICFISEEHWWVVSTQFQNVGVCVWGGGEQSFPGRHTEEFQGQTDRVIKGHQTQHRCSVKAS